MVTKGLGCGTCIHRCRRRQVVYLKFLALAISLLYSSSPKLLCRWVYWTCGLWRSWRASAVTLGREYPWNPRPSRRTTIQVFGRRVSSISNDLTYSKRDLAMSENGEEGCQAKKMASTEAELSLLMSRRIDSDLFEAVLRLWLINLQSLPTLTWKAWSSLYGKESSSSALKENEYGDFCEMALQQVSLTNGNLPPSPIYVFRGHIAEITSLTFIRDNLYLASGYLKIVCIF